jgi:predicted DCC family thiol-disulfide oxidoreductase YuxK
MATDHGIVLYDGVCGFCDRVVRWLLDHDPAGWFRYAPLQGATAAELRARHAEIPEELDTVVYIECDAGEECVYLRSEAAFRIVAKLAAPWRWLALFRVLPRGFTDFVYLRFVRARYRMFGRLDACRLPSGPEQSRFLA